MDNNAQQIGSSLVDPNQPKQREFTAQYVGQSFKGKKDFIRYMT